MSPWRYQRDADGRKPFPPALASPRFRLASQSLPFSLGRWLSELRAVFGRGGRPNGMVHLLVVSVCLVATCAKQPAEGLGGDAMTD